MKLMTKELKAKFPKLYANENKKPEEIPIICKFFDPVGSWTWYATEYDPKDKLFFGFVRGADNEFGYFSLEELQSVKGICGLGIERDLHFGEHMLSEAIEKRI